jgi:DNA-binding NarL/FixJ family response regulator
MKKLTIRECEVLSLMRDGRPNEDIARELIVTKHTIKAHMSSLFRKTQAKNRTHLVYIAMKNNWID